VPPELREDRGEIEAALAHRLPALVSLEDIRGDLQMHTAWSDGQATTEEMVRGCLARGYEYLAITDHSHATTVARGLAPGELERQRREIEQVRRRVRGIHILHGMEVDILRDGTLDLPDEELGKLDVVVVAVHSSMRLAKTRMTERVIRATSHGGRGRGAERAAGPVGPGRRPRAACQGSGRTGGGEHRCARRRPPALHGARRRPGTTRVVGEARRAQRHALDGAEGMAAWLGARRLRRPVAGELTPAASA
jgi:hypothetical protein